MHTAIFEIKTSDAGADEVNAGDAGSCKMLPMQENAAGLRDIIYEAGQPKKKQSRQEHAKRCMRNTIV